MIRKIAHALAIVFVTCLAPPLVVASQVRLVDLEQMTQRAGRIFSGRCAGASVDFDPALGWNVTVATFEVDRAIKGVTGDTVTVRMLGAAVHGSSGDARERGPAFRTGEQVILFLYGENERGLSSPVGLGQGRFRIFTDKQGRRLAINEFGNRGLLAGLRPDVRVRLEARSGSFRVSNIPLQSEELDTTALLDAVETLVTVEP